MHSGVGRTAALRPPLGGGRIRRRKLGGWWIRHRNHRDGPLDEGNIGKGGILHFYVCSSLCDFVDFDHPSQILFFKVDFVIMFLGDEHDGDLSGDGEPALF